MCKSRFHESKLYLDVCPASDSIGNIIMKTQYAVEQFVVQLTQKKLIIHYHPYVMYMFFFTFALSVIVIQLVL